MHGMAETVFELFVCKLPSGSVESVGERLRFRQTVLFAVNCGQLPSRPVRQPVVLPRPQGLLCNANGMPRTKRKSLPDGGREMALTVRISRCGTAGLALLGGIALAQAAEAQPVPEARVNPVPQGSPIPRILPPAPPSVGPGTVIPRLPPVPPIVTQQPSAPEAEVPKQRGRSPSGS